MALLAPFFTRGRTFERSVLTCLNLRIVELMLQCCEIFVIYDLFFAVRGHVCCVIVGTVCGKREIYRFGGGYRGERALLSAEGDSGVNFADVELNAAKKSLGSELLDPGLTRVDARCGAAQG